MNLYFLVEGQTERKLYPKWLEYLVPGLIRIFDPGEADQDNYFLISGGGYPCLLDNHLENSIRDISDAANYDYFVIALDADESVEVKIEEVNNRLADSELDFILCQAKVIVQNRCIETWFLGNRPVFKRNPTAAELVQCIGFYNVFNDDPERMGKPDEFEASVSSFHFEYLRLMLAERNIRYSKKYPGYVLEPHYIDQLKARLDQTPGHLNSLKNVLDFCTLLGNNMEQTVTKEINHV